MSRADDEIDFHLDMLTRELIEGGLDAEAARAEALRRFGDAAAVRNSARERQRARINVALTFLALALVSFSHRLLWYIPQYAWLHQHRPYYFAESLKTLFEIGVCLAALLAMGQRRLTRALALDRRILPAALFGVVATAPTLVGLFFTRSSHVTDWISIAYLAVYAPFAEELATRGFAYRSLRRSGWPLWMAALACALVSGAGHVEKGQSMASILGLFFVIGTGSAIFCWLFERWQSLWFPFALHALMNFWWEVFNVAPTALGGWFAFALQSSSILLAVLITLRFTSPRPDRGDVSAHTFLRRACQKWRGGNDDDDFTRSDGQLLPRLWCSDQRAR